MSSKKADKNRARQIRRELYDKKRQIKLYVDSIGKETNRKIDYKSLKFNKTTVMYEYQQKAVASILEDKKSNPSYGLLLNAEPGKTHTLLFYFTHNTLGLGKTVMAQDIMLHEYQQLGEKAGNTLIVIPVALERQWSAEFYHHTNIPASMIKAYTSASIKKNKREPTLTPNAPNIVIATYDKISKAFKNEKHWIFRPNLFSLIIADEAQFFKDPKTLVCSCLVYTCVCYFVIVIFDSRITEKKEH